MVSSGLASVGYKYINIDDGFFYGRNEDGSLKIHPVKFPNGIKPVIDYIHAKGLKAGSFTMMPELIPVDRNITTRQVV